MATHPPSQADQPDFALFSLGWKSFQELCLTIVREIFGQNVESFSTVHDGGRDGAFKGKWRNIPSGPQLTGTFTFQCKHTSRPSESLSLSMLADEILKARSLARRGLAKNYVLLTNLIVSGPVEADLRKEFLSIPGITTFHLFGKEWITSQIRESARLRMLVPRVYGLGDLSQILDERVYAQAKQILFAMKDTLSKFVITEPYRKSVLALEQHGFVMLLGEPASGKSTIAASLALAAADQWGATTAKLVSPDDFKTHWNVNEQCQLFWIDDAFGTTQYQRERAFAWNHVFPLMQAAVKRGAKIVMTSRDYIFKNAIEALKTTEFPLLNSSQVVIHVQDLTESERDQILYNHVKLGSQPTTVKRALKPHLAEIAAHKSFTPELARRLGNPQFTRQLVVNRDELRKFIEKPKAFLQDVIQTLDPDSQASLCLLFMRGGTLSVEAALSDKETQTIVEMGGSVGGVHRALKALNESLIQLAERNEGRYWTFKHPTISDAFSSFIAQNPRLLELYLDRTPVETLIGEITCGNVGLEGVKVIVLPHQYPKIVARLKELKDRRSALLFLSYRCDQGFLSAHVVKPANRDHYLNIYSYLHACDEISLLSRLHKLGILPDDWREELIRKIGDLAVTTPDSDFLTVKDIRELVGEEATKFIMARVQAEVLPKLDDLVGDCIGNCPSRESEIDNHFDLLEDCFVAFAEYLSGEDGPIGQLELAIEELKSARSDMLARYDSSEAYERFDFGDRPASPKNDRSIFDDVDE